MKTKQRNEKDCKNVKNDCTVEFTIEDSYKEPKQWTIITALDRVLDQAEDSMLSQMFWNNCKAPMEFLTKELGLTPFQVVVIAILVDNGEPLSWRGIGNFLGCRRLTIMTYSDEMEDLVGKRWIYRRAAREMRGNYDGFALSYGVVTALRNNKPFVPEKIDGLNIQAFVKRIEGHLDKTLGRHDIPFEYDEEWLMQMCKANPQLPLCQEVLKYDDDIHVQSLMLLEVYDYSQFADSENEGLTLSLIDNLYPEDYEANNIRFLLTGGRHDLMEAGLLEHACNDGVADTTRFRLTRKFKEELLEGFVPSKSKCTKAGRNRELRSHDGIKAKDMFYNADDQEQIERLTSLLSQEHFSGVQERLVSEGMRKGFACLFYGAPGTGKTETVLQIARQTGRDIMQIDIAGMRDKYVGESEKNIKAVFARYRFLCRNSEVTPILFFNEADGIFGKRTNVGGRNASIEKMDNAMQNIILEEMENLEGILIATTNLTCNLDSAFERRFLFKVEFHKPETEVKAKLWTSMLGENITEDEAKTLAERYDFSGGQIENIARKRTIDYIISGKPVTIDDIDTYCQHEMLGSKSIKKNRVGFVR